MVESN